MGYAANYITRALSVYESNYRDSYNAGVITEIIGKLQDRDEQAQIERVINQQKLPGHFSSRR